MAEARLTATGLTSAARAKADKHNDPDRHACRGRLRQSLINAARDQPTAMLADPHKPRQTAYQPTHAQASRVP
jgi:hypothetical protein